MVKCTHVCVVSPMQGHTDRVYGVAFHHDSSKLVSCSKDKTLRIWSAADHHTIATLQVSGVGCLHTYHTKCPYGVP
jgi:WD40 repeat protein